MPAKPYKNSSLPQTSVEELVMEIHRIHPELLERQVRVLVVGCGGTGSAVVAGLPYPLSHGCGCFCNQEKPKGPQLLHRKSLQTSLSRHSLDFLLAEGLPNRGQSVVPADGASAKKATEDSKEVIRQRLPIEVAHNHGATSPPAHAGEYLDRLSFCQVM